MKIVIVLEDEPGAALNEHQIAEVEVYENSSYEELAVSALRKLGQMVSEKNIEKMREVVRAKIEGYVRQLSRGIRNMEKQRKGWVR